MTSLIQTMKKSVPAALAIAAVGVLGPALSGPAMAVPAMHHVDYMTRQTPCNGTVNSQLQHPGGRCGTNPYMPLNGVHRPAPQPMYGYGPIR